MTTDRTSRDDAAFIRHFGRAVGENWRMHRVSDRAVRRARATGGKAEPGS